MNSMKLWRVIAEKNNGIQLITWYFDTQEAIKQAIKMQDDITVKHVALERI